jgi:tetrapyrrole methylase family protein/MazG family protein
MVNEENAFGRLCGIVRRLRGPGGCPWDREQNPSTLRDDLVEETYECIEAIDEEDPPHVREELGDLFLLVTMIAYMHEQEGFFTISGVLEGISEKLIRRHPHVFAGTGDANLSSAEVLDNWAKIKVEQEGRAPKDSLLDEVSRSLPPLERACKLQKKAAKGGFDWPTIEGVLAKLREELEETEEVLSGDEPAAGGRLEEELGDLLFSAVNLCRRLKVEPQAALRRANAKFTRRFKYVEKVMKENGQELGPGNLELMDRLWEEAKGKSL